jgi:pyruvate/2-oxoglutarate dehydrogenase complex dihydrolipoamide acyltransferase (E2) component
MRRLAVLLTLFAVAAPAPLAFAQTDPENPFGPLPQAAPAETPTPTPPPTAEAQDDTDRTLLFAIGGGLLVLFLVIARVITRDARYTLKSQGRDEAPRLREQGPHRHARQAKAKARARTKAQRRARRQNR